MAKKQHDHVDHPLERLMFFSDAVFAIAITLLVIEIHIPHLETGNPAESWSALSKLIPSFAAYILSFAVIGRFWMAHHTMLGAMEGHTPKLMWPNMILLMFVAFMPFATAYFAANMHNLAPLQFYNIILLGLAMASARVSWIATQQGNTRAGFSDSDRETMRGRALGVILTASITLLASFFIGNGLSQILLALMPVMQKLAIGVRLKKLTKVAAKDQEATG